MTTAIIYISSHGTTELVAQKIKSGLGEAKAQLFNLKKDKNIDLDDFDQIILGSSIHAGQTQRTMKKFLKNEKERLLKKPLGIFLCCMDENRAQQQLEMNYPEELRVHAKSAQLCGGEFRLQKMNFMEKLIIKKVAGVTESASKINEHAILQLIEDMSSN